MEFFGFESIRSQPNYDGKGKIRIVYCYKVFVIYQPLLTNRKLTRVGGLTLPGVFTREKVNPPARVTLARR